MNLVRLTLLASVLVAAVAPASAQAYWELSPTDDPLIFAPIQVPGDDYTLKVCAPGGAACELVDEFTGPEYEPGETPAGTFFELWNNGVLEERSPEWKGRVTNTAPPTISGSVAVGGEVAPVGGTWSGGWANDRSTLSLVACMTPQGNACIGVPAADQCRPCVENPMRAQSSGEGPAAIPPALGGRYLLATESRWSVDVRGRGIPGIAASPLWAMQTAFNLRPASSRRAVSAPVGPIVVRVPAVNQPPVAPTVTLRARALRSKGKLRVGRITCATSCTVSVKVSGGGKKASTTTFVAKPGVTAITTAVRRGKLTVRVHVDGKLLANAKVATR
jgi:hypothetical protein